MQQQRQALLLPQNLQTPKTTDLNRDNFIMSKLKDSLFTAISPSKPISSQVKALIEPLLHQFFSNLDTPTHPPYASMIERAIRELKEEKSSEAAISAFIKREYKGLPYGHDSFLSHHLRKLCRGGSILLADDGRYMLLVDSGDVEQRSSKRQRSRDGQSGVHDRDSLEKQNEVVSSLSHDWVINKSEMQLVENPRESFHTKESDVKITSELIWMESNHREAVECKVLDEQHQKIEHARGAIEFYQRPCQQNEMLVDSKQKTEVGEEEQARNKHNEIFEEPSESKRLEPGSHDPSCVVELGNVEDMRVFTYEEEDQTSPTTYNSFVSYWNLDGDHSSLPFKGMCMDSEKIKRSDEQLLEFSPSWRKAREPKDSNLRSVVEVKRRESVEREQREFQKCADSVIREQSQPQEQKIDTRAEILVSCHHGEADAVVNLRSPFAGPSLPVLAGEKQEARPQRKSLCEQREYVIVCGLIAQKHYEKKNIRVPKENVCGIIAQKHHQTKNRGPLKLTPRSTSAKGAIGHPCS